MNVQNKVFDETKGRLNTRDKGEDIDNNKSRTKTGSGLGLGSKAKFNFRLVLNV